MKKSLFLLFVFSLCSCAITTHRVEDMQYSKTIAPETENGFTSFKFQSQIQKEKTRDWLRNYFDLPENDDLVYSEVQLFPDVDYTFFVSVDLSHDRKKSLYLHEFFSKDQKVETHEGPIKFFVSIWVTDAFNEDHLSRNSIFQQQVHQYLLELEKEFVKYSEENPDPKYFNG